MTPRILVYVAGPFSPTAAQKAAGVERRAAVEQNIARAGAVAVSVAALGAMPVCPHLNTSLPEFEEVQDYQFWIEGTDEMLRRCDAALFVAGREASSGSRSEWKTCKAAKIPAFTSLAELEEFLRPMATDPIPPPRWDEPLPFSVVSSLSSVLPSEVVRPLADSLPRVSESSAAVVNPAQLSFGKIEV
jgi:hypothetical protein